MSETSTLPPLPQRKIRIVSRNAEKPLALKYRPYLAAGSAPGVTEDGVQLAVGERIVGIGMRCDTRQHLHFNNNTDRIGDHGKLRCDPGGQTEVGVRQEARQHSLAWDRARGNLQPELLVNDVNSHGNAGLHTASSNGGQDRTASCPSATSTMVLCTIIVRTISGRKSGNVHTSGFMLMASLARSRAVSAFALCYK